MSRAGDILYTDVDLLDMPPKPKSFQESGLRERFSEWIACREPERPFDGNTCFHDCCKACLIALDAAHMRTGYDPQFEMGFNVREAMRKRLDAYGEAPP